MQVVLWGGWLENTRLCHPNFMSTGGAAFEARPWELLPPAVPRLVIRALLKALHSSNLPHLQLQYITGPDSICLL